MKTAPYGYLTLPTNRVHRLRNINCAYCGRLFDDNLRSTLEHVIGRKFVPKGTLNASFNLHVNACERCNNIKSDLEDDISVISMHPDTLGRFPSQDDRLKADVRRKSGKSISRRTRKPVAAGEPPMVIKANLGDVAQFTFTMQSPPQADEQRLFRLAYFQLQAFFFMITYKEDTRCGGFFLGEYMPLIAVRREDWGNEQLVWFERETKDWLERFHLITADEHFKIWIRRKSEDQVAWAWALEWNQNFRLAGFIGEPEHLRAQREAVPSLNLQTIHESPGRSLKVRTEVPLKEGEDTLFGLRSVEHASI